MTQSQTVPKKTLKSNASKNTQKNELVSTLLKLKEISSGITLRLILRQFCPDNKSENKTKKAETVSKATLYPLKPQYVAERSLYISSSSPIFQRFNLINETLINQLMKIFPFIDLSKYDFNQI
jgi:hypothetical protein